MERLAEWQDWSVNRLSTRILHHWLAYYQETGNDLGVFPREAPPVRRRRK